MLKLETTYVNRGNTNEVVYEMARERGSNRIVKLSECYENLKLTFFAKLVLAPETDPRRKVIFADTSLRPHDHWKKRVGRPRLNWV